MSRLSEMRTSHTRDRFLPRQIGDMDEGVVEGREDVRNAEH